MQNTWALAAALYRDSILPRELLQQIADTGIKIAYVTFAVHVGFGTFRPVKEEKRTLEHHTHPEYYQVTGGQRTPINEMKRF